MITSKHSPQKNPQRMWLKRQEETFGGNFHEAHQTAAKDYQHAYINQSILIL